MNIDKQLPKGWKWATIDDLFAVMEDGATLHQGWSPRCENGPSISENDWGVLKTTSVQAGIFLPEHNKRLPDTLTSRPQIEVKSGDLLITCAGPRARCGVACLVRNTRPRLMISGKIYRFRVPEEQVEPRLVEAYLQTTAAHDEIDRIKTGGSDSGLNLTHDRFRKLSIPVAPRNEQRRIVAKLEELLTQLDAGIEELRKAQAQLKRYRQAVLKAAVTGEVTKQWREAHKNEVEPASELLLEILKERRARWESEQCAKMANGRTLKNEEWRNKYKSPFEPRPEASWQLPENWTWASIDQLSTACQYGTSARAFSGINGIPVLRMGNIVDGYLSLDELKYLPPMLDELRAVMLTKGDMLFNRTNSAELVGKTAVYQGKPQPCAFASYLIRVSFGDMIAPEFISYFLNSTFGRNWIASVVNQQVGQANVNATKLKALTVPLPPAEEQLEIVAQVERAFSIGDEVHKNIDRELKHAERMRRSILKRAFEGKLVSQDSNDEPAEQLLEQIKMERARREAEKQDQAKSNRKQFSKNRTKRTERLTA